MINVNKEYRLDRAGIRLAEVVAALSLAITVACRRRCYRPQPVSWLRLMSIMP